MDKRILKPGFVTVVLTLNNSTLPVLIQINKLDIPKNGLRRFLLLQ